MLILNFATCAQNNKLDVQHIKIWGKYASRYPPSILFTCIFSVHEFADEMVYDGGNASNPFGVLYVWPMTKALTIF